jgi:hypothetical protein
MGGQSPQNVGIQQQAASIQPSALPAMSYGGAMNSVKISPDNKWNIPEDGMAKEITSSINGAMKQIGSAYMQNESDNMADQRMQKRFAMQKSMYEPAPTGPWFPYGKN